MGAEEVQQPEDDEDGEEGNVEEEEGEVGEGGEGEEVGGSSCGPALVALVRLGLSGPGGAWDGDRVVQSEPHRIETMRGPGRLYPHIFQRSSAGSREKRCWWVARVSWVAPRREASGMGWERVPSRWYSID